MELDTLAQMESVGQAVFRDLIALGQAGLKLTGFRVDAVHALIHPFSNLTSLDVSADRTVERGFGVDLTKAKLHSFGAALVRRLGVALIGLSAGILILVGCRLTAITGSEGKQHDERKQQRQQFFGFHVSSSFNYIFSA